MRRINKDDCKNAVNKLSEIAFDKKIEKIVEEFKVIGDKLINAYIPKPLIALSKEYPDLFIDKEEMYYYSSLRTSKILDRYNLCSV